MNKKTLHKTQRGLLICGLVVAAFGLVTQAINYPWNTLTGTEVIADDPTPVSSTWITESRPADDEELVYLTNGKGDRTAADAENAVQVGIVKLPRTGAADNVVEGVEPGDLALGAGHLPGSALPGEDGNCVIAGDRTGQLMSHLNLLEEGDTILLSDEDTQYTYTVFSATTVEPTEVYITEPVSGRDAVLTLFTGTPEGSLKHRLVVQAELTAEEART